jgi:hypothetical protein
VSAVGAIRRKLLEISATADTAAGALDGAAVGFLAPELARHLAALEALARHLEEVCSHLAGGRSGPALARTTTRPAGMVTAPRPA